VDLILHLFILTNMKITILCLLPLITLIAHTQKNALIAQFFWQGSSEPGHIRASSETSTSAGDLADHIFKIENSKTNAAYRWRFKSSVEDEQYLVKNLENPLPTEALSGKRSSAGFIRDVRFDLH
jgi:hypothetical protein